ncbi:TrbC/VirB2 family protein [Coralloluteibacterium stylophorae]|uniref:TrbC/VirB2 family protein n=1 Tax=Coralloluteibacterium stylophorae TaxID=1776034 RepID=A0AAP2CCV1_9GAMM|nr:TrbC/VirB2 family protein [Coralloluteibacterium stylophorae]MBS7458576.1 TrbC/VirB2 family protein [Coralloluteibacterium stylophorae]
MKHTKRTSSRSTFASRVSALAVAVPLAALPMLAVAQEVTNNVNEFFDNITGLLGIASVAIVTIAVIFSGYQIAFNHKRIGDVAPVLIGGFLIGAAAQIAAMLLPESGATAMVVVETMTRYA